MSQVALEVYEQAVQGRQYFRAAYGRTLRQLRELSDAAQAVLDAEVEYDRNDSRDAVLRQLEAVLAKL